MADEVEQEETSFNTADDDNVEPEDEVFLDSGTYREDLADDFMRWEISGFYDANGKAPNSVSLKRNPPVLTLENASGAVSFVLTKESANDLASVLTDVKRAYFNAPTMRGEQLAPDHRSEIQKLKDWMQLNPIKTAVGVVVICIFLYSFISSVF